jgi:phenylacetate-CoA ligase
MDCKFQASTAWRAKSPVRSSTPVFIWNQNVESLPRQELDRLQFEKLKRQLERVKLQLPFYQKLFKSTDSIKSKQDLSSLPFTTKADLRANYPYGLLGVERQNLTRIHASSGTKGKSTIVAYTQKDMELWTEACARSLACAGVKPGDILQNSYGYGLFTGGLGIHQGAEKLGACVIPASSGKTRQQVELLQDLGVNVLCCTPSYALNLIMTMEEMGIHKDQMPLHLGIFGAEPWGEGLRNQIEERFALQALDIYGLSEIIGPGVSVECPLSKGWLHLWEDLFLPEIIDPLTGQVVEPGVEGELVLTSLEREALPLVRYRTGDLTSLLYDQCGCGRTMVRMKRVRARIDDMLIIRGINVYPSEIETILSQIDDLACQYQLIVRRDKALDTLEIQVEITDKLFGEIGISESPSQNNYIMLSSQVASRIKETLGLQAVVTLLPPSSIKRSEGKACRVIDLRQSTE